MSLRTLAAFALALLLAPPVLAATHQVMQTGIAFVPGDLTIEVGDTVEWVFSAGSHTVTEGTDDMNPPIGSKLFDEPLNAGSPLVSYTFVDAGDVSYYCRPHRVVGMTGVIHVEQATSALEPEQRAWSRIKSLYR
ncbi:plastocyanin [bacterium]|nr:plastocyanin [bacterium]